MAMPMACRVDLGQKTSRLTHFCEAQNYGEPLVVGATTSDGSTAFVEDGNESEPRPPHPP